MTENPVLLGVLASGRGSNFEAILRRQAEGYFRRARIACLITDVPAAGALAIAAQHDIPATTIIPRQFPAKDDYEAEVAGFLEAHGADFVALAGYMRIVGRTLISRFPQRILNIHPALLPSFPGLHGQKQAIDHGVKVSGCTVHFVDPGVDTGPIIVQRAVPVLAGDTEETLSKRILAQEHIAYSEAIRMITEEPWFIDGRVVRFPERENNQGALSP
jgi:phosphoribosylglycinamide formyltransferase-1